MEQKFMDILSQMSPEERENLIERMREIVEAKKHTPTPIPKKKVEMAAHKRHMTNTSIRERLREWDKQAKIERDAIERFLKQQE